MLGDNTESAIFRGLTNNTMTLEPNVEYLVTVVDLKATQVQVLDRIDMIVFCDLHRPERLKEGRLWHLNSWSHLGVLRLCRPPPIQH